MAVRLKEGKKPRVAGDGINISDNNVISVLLRATNNLIHVNENRELYVDLQLEDGIEPTDEFPVGITTGKILAEDGRQRSGIILNRKTTSGDYVRLILANNGTLYIDKGTGIWEEIGGGGGGGDSNVKEFVLPNLSNPTVGQQIVDWYLDGNYPIVVYNGSSYIVESRVNSTTLRLYDIHTTVTHWLNQGKSTVQRNALYVYWDANGDFVDAGIDVIAIAPYVIDTNQTYQNPYIPTDDGNPTSKYYVDLHDTYIDQTAPSNPYQGQLWYDITNNVLKSYDGTSWNTVGGGGGGGSYTAGYGINIDGSNEISNSLPFDPENQGRVGQVIKKTATGIEWAFEGGGGGTGETYLPGDNIVFDVQGTPDTQGPCPDGFHIPTKTEMDSLISAATIRGYNLDYETNFLLPKVGYYDPDQYQLNLIDQGTTGYYWTSSYDSSGKAFLFDIASNTTVAKDTVVGAMIRPFADDPMEPDFSDPDWEYVNYLLYHNATLGVISFSPDGGTSWITIADKNYGATAPYGSSTGYSETYCGKFHQWGNNIGLAWLGTQITPSTVETNQVDASAYGPGNYYSADELYLISGSWDSSDNANLWGGQSQGYQTVTYISADYSEATSTDKGVIKLGSDTVQTEPAQTPSSDTGRTFPVQLDANGKAVVNVPGGGGSGINATPVTISSMIGQATKTGTTADPSYVPTAGDFLLLTFTNGNSADNVRISINNGALIYVSIGGANTGGNFYLSAGANVLVYFDGTSYLAYVSNLTGRPVYTGRDGITIDNNNVISNDLYPSNQSTATAGQVLKKTAQGTEWANDSAGGDVSGPSSATDGHLAVFDGTSGKDIKDGGAVPKGLPSGGSAGQVVKKTANGAEWANEKDTTYTAGDGINISAQNEISNALRPTNQGAAYDVLYMTQGGNTAWAPNLPIIINEETNLWELGPGPYVIGMNKATGDASPIKLNCKNSGGLEVGYFYAWYGSSLTIAEKFDQGQNQGMYYSMMNGWWIHYGYADASNGTYRKIYLHQNDPITLTCAANLDVDLNESLNYTLVLDQDCNLTFGQTPGYATFTPGCVYQFLIIQDSTGGHRLTLPNNFIYAGGNSTFPTSGGSITKLILDYQDGNYFASITQFL